MNLKFLIYGINFAPEIIGVGKYNGELAQYLIEQGHSVTAITTPPYYPDWEISSVFGPNRYTFETHAGMEIIRCPIYVPKKPNLLRRLMHLLSFSISSLPIAMYHFFARDYDLAICVEPTKVIAPQSLILSKISRVPVWLHIQDFELGAFNALNNQRKSNFLDIIDGFLSKRYDAVSSISKKMLLAAKSRYSLKDENLFLFPNWVDTKFLRPSKGKHQLRAKWGLNEHDVVVMYSGNLGNKQGLETIPKLAEFFAQDKRIKFVVVGKGSFREILESAAEELPNLFVFDLLPYDRLPALLNSADIHLVIQKREFSDLVMPSKLTSILACGGNAIVTADPDTELGTISKENPDIYTLIEPESLVAITDAISAMIPNPSFSRYNETARAYAENHLEKEIVLSTFVSDVEAFLESR